MEPVGVETMSPPTTLFKSASVTTFQSIVPPSSNRQRSGSIPLIRVTRYLRWNGSSRATYRPQGVPGGAGAPPWCGAPPEIIAVRRQFPAQARGHEIAISGGGRVVNGHVPSHRTAAGGDCLEGESRSLLLMFPCQYTTSSLPVAALRSQESSWSPRPHSETSFAPKSSSV